MNTVDSCAHGTAPAGSSLPAGGPSNLRFLATRAMPRQLEIEINRGLIFVSLYAPGKNFISLVSGSTGIERATLHLDTSTPCLFIGLGVFFRLTASEAVEIERVLGPLGLQIAREKS